MNIHRSHLNCCTIANLKTRIRSKTLTVSQRMGGGKIFLKNLRDTTFNIKIYRRSLISAGSDTTFIKIYRISLISAGSISLDSTFKTCFIFCYFFIFRSATGRRMRYSHYTCATGNYFFTQAKFFVGLCGLPQSTYFTVRGQSYFSRLPKY